MDTAIKHPVSDWIKTPFVIFWHPGTLTLRAEHQSAWMSKITNDGLTRSGTGCFIAVTVGVKGLKIPQNATSRHQRGVHTCFIHFSLPRGPSGPRLAPQLPLLFCDNSQTANNLKLSPRVMLRLWTIHLDGMNSMTRWESCVALLLT